MIFWRQMRMAIAVIMLLVSAWPALASQADIVICFEKHGRVTVELAPGSICSDFIARIGDYSLQEWPVGVGFRSAANFADCEFCKDVSVAISDVAISQAVNSNSNIAADDKNSTVSHIAMLNETAEAWGARSVRLSLAPTPPPSLRLPFSLTSLRTVVFLI